MHAANNRLEKLRLQRLQTLESQSSHSKKGTKQQKSIRRKEWDTVTDKDLKEINLNPCHDAL